MKAAGNCKKAINEEYYREEGFTEPEPKARM